MSYEQSNYGQLPMSLGGLLYQSLSLMSSYDMQVQRQWLEYLQDQAKAQTGIVDNFLKISIDAADENAAALQDAAIGALVSGAVGLAGAGFSLGSALRSDSATESQLNDAKLFQKQLNSGSSAQLEIRGDEQEIELQTYNSDEIQGKIQDWTSGDKSKLEEFGNGSDKSLNAAAVDHLKAARSEEYNTVCKNVSDQISDLQKRLDSFHATMSQQVQTSSQLTQAAGGIAQGAGQSAQAAQMQVSQADQARAQVVQQTEQQWNTSIGQAGQTAQQFAQDAWSIAAAFGQITQTRA